MRYLLPCFALLFSCSQGQEQAATIATGVFAGEGRNRLCIAGDAGNYRGGLITFGSGDVNCSASGRLEVQDGKIALIPRGEGDCRIPISIEGSSVGIGEVPAACSYYCGPGASMAGKAFGRDVAGATAADLAGDPLC